MLILGLGRSAVLCNMLKLMLCNKWANPPKACPLWQKHKALGQAWRSLCLSRRQTGSSQWVSVSLWETPRTWLIVRDMCPRSLAGSRELSLVGVRGEAVECAQANQSVQRNICSESGLLRAHVLIQEMKSPPSFDTIGFSKCYCIKIKGKLYLSVDFMWT